MADRVGQQLGHYRLIHLLGHGGFADVYLGEHMRLRTLAAIKVLHAQLTNEEVEDFLLEARTVARLVHPHIIRVFDFDVERGVPFLVTDYAPNGTLRGRHPKGVPVPLATIIPYVRQIADALQYAHDEQVIHRDVKPENMLLGRRDEVLLNDFGAAIVHRTLTHDTQQIAGTAQYMAPEQFKGRPHPASDQYALGVVVYEWLCGERLFQGSLSALYSQHLFEKPPALRKKVPSLPPAVEQVVMRALAKEPKDRFEHVQAFANALEQASQIKPMVAYRVIEDISTQPTTELYAYRRIFSPTNAPTAEQFWSFPTGGRIASAPAVAKGVVYVGSYDKNLYALDAATGSPLWVFSTQGIIDSAPAVSRDIVYVSSADKHLYALDATTGSLVWSFSTGDIIASSPAVAKGIVYVGSYDKNLYALDATTGVALWTFATEGSIVSSPAIASSVVYVGSEDKHLYALNATTGSKLWSFSTGDIIESSPIVANRAVYVGSFDKNLYALNATTGSQLWVFSTQGLIDSSPAVAKGVVYVGSYDKSLYALDARTGSQLWSLPTGDIIASSPAVAKGVVYVSSADTYLYALNATTGSPLWTFPEANSIRSSPTVADGVVYVGSFDGTLCAFGVGT